METERTIAHLDLDAFFVACELSRRPELAGKPVVISGRGPRAVVSTASYKARERGVGSGMPALKAKRMCPRAVFLPVDMKYYRERSAEVMELIEEMRVNWERASVDEVYMDLSTLAYPIDRARELVREIKRQLDLDASVGIGPNKLIAKIASDLDKPRGFTILSLEQARERLADESVRLIPGVGPKTRDRLEDLEITTISQLATCQPLQLQQAFGERRGLELSMRGQLLSESPIAQRVAKSRSVETTFTRDIRGAQQLLPALKEQAEKLSQQLKDRSQSGRTISIKLRHQNFTTVTRARTIAEATNDNQVIFDTAQDLLLKYDPQQPVRLLGIRVGSFANITSTAEGKTGKSDMLVR